MTKPALTNVQVALPYRTRRVIEKKAEKASMALSEYLREILTLQYSPEVYVNKLEEE